MEGVSFGKEEEEMLQVCHSECVPPTTLQKERAQNEEKQGTHMQSTEPRVCWPGHLIQRSVKRNLARAIIFMALQPQFPTKVQLTQATQQPQQSCANKHASSQNDHCSSSQMRDAKCNCLCPPVHCQSLNQVRLRQDISPTSFS